MKHKVLFNRLTSVEDLQNAWHLRLFCANTRVTYSLRGLPHQETEHFATEHDADSKRCLSLLLDSCEKSSLPMSLGGCGLRSASRTSSSAYWASWADSLRMIHQRHPAVADQMVRSLTQVSGHRHFVAAAACRDQLIACGFSLLRGRKLPWLVPVRSSRLSMWMDLVSLCRVRNMSRPRALRIISSSPSCSPVVSHRSVRCSVPKVVLSLVCRSSLALLLPTSGSLPTSSGCSSYAVSTSRFLSRPALVGVAVLSTPVAITAQVARLQGSWDVVDSPWSPLPPVSVAKQVHA